MGTYVVLKSKVNPKQMYKTKKKPDLLFMLAVFVGLGVLISTQTLSVSNTNGANSASVRSETAEPTTVEESSVQPSKTVEEVQKGDLVKVSNTLYPPLPTEI